MPYFDKEKGRWRGTVMLKGERKTSLHDTKKDAKEWEHDMRVRLKDPPPEQLRIANMAYDWWLHSKKRGLNKTTLSNRRKFARDIVDYFFLDDVSEIDLKELTNFAYSYDTPSKKNRARKRLVTLYNYMMRFHGNIVKENLALKIDLVDEEERKPQRVATEQEVAKLLAAADRWDRNMLIAYCTSGARKSELFNLTWEDVNFEKGYITVKNRKGTGKIKKRNIPMNDTLRYVLQDQWKTKLPHSNYVFQNRAEWVDKNGKVIRKHPNHGKAFTARRRFLPGLCKRAGVPQMGFHALRRFFTSVMVDKYKSSLPVLQKLLGHEKTTTTERYVYNISEDVREAIGQLDGLDIFRREEARQEAGTEE